MGHRIAILNEGVLQQVGPPQEVYARPANLFVAQFIGNPPMNTLAGTVTSTGTGLAVEVSGGRIPLPDDSAAPREAGSLGPPADRANVRADAHEVVVGARPEHMSLDPDGQVDATVAVVEALGHEQHVLCRVEDGTMLIVRQPGDAPLMAMGEAVRVSFDIDRLHLFDAATKMRLEPDSA